MFSMRVAAASLLFAAAAEADVCKPLQLYASLPLTTDGEARRLYVPVEIAGKPMRLILDTGAHASFLTDKVVQELGLDVLPAPVRSYGLTGTYTEKMATAPMKLGQLSFQRVQFMVTPENFWAGEPDVAGLLGANLLSRYDLSLDLANAKLEILSQDHCPDHVIYWPAEAYSKVPFELNNSGNIVITVKLDGHPLQAILDTGATNSTLTIRKARGLYGLNPGDAETPQSGILNGDRNLITYNHTFKTLDFDGIAVANPNIVLIPDVISEKLSHTATGSRIPDRDSAVDSPMLLGMNIIRHMHLYIAYKEKMLYFTPASKPAATQ